MTPEICEYCCEDPCSCPIFDMPDDEEIPDDRTDCDADEPSEDDDL